MSEIDGAICSSDKTCKRYTTFEFFLGKKKLHVWVKKKDYWITNLKTTLIANKEFKSCYDVIIYSQFLMDSTRFFLVKSQTCQKVWGSLLGYVNLFTKSLTGNQQGE